MAENLTEFMAQLEQTRPGQFAPGVHYYDGEADSLTLYLRNEESYACRLNSLVTIFLSQEEDRLVGCQVKGLMRKLLSDGSLALAILRNGQIQLGLFFHLLAFEIEEPESRNSLIELGQETKEFTLDTQELIEARSELAGCGSNI